MVSLAVRLVEDAGDQSGGALGLSVQQTLNRLDAFGRTGAVRTQPLPSWLLHPSLEYSGALELMRGKGGAEL